jgi:hypothetical protein
MALAAQRPVTLAPMVLAEPQPFLAVSGRALGLPRNTA